MMAAQAGQILPLNLLCIPSYGLCAAIQWEICRLAVRLGESRAGSRVGRTDDWIEQLPTADWLVDSSSHPSSWLALSREVSEKISTDRVCWFEDTTGNYPNAPSNRYPNSSRPSDEKPLTGSPTGGKRTELESCVDWNSRPCETVFD